MPLSPSSAPTFSNIHVFLYDQGAADPSYYDSPSYIRLTGAYYGDDYLDESTNVWAFVCPESGFYHLKGSVAFPGGAGNLTAIVLVGTKDLLVSDTIASTAGDRAVAEGDVYIQKDAVVKLKMKWSGTAGSSDQSGNPATFLSGWMVSSGTAEEGSTTPDTTGPVITDIVITDLATDDEEGNPQISVTWTTNEPATSQVRYSTDMSFADENDLDPSLVTSHSVTLSLVGATRPSTYNIQVESLDGNANTTNEEDDVELA